MPRTLLSLAAATPAELRELLTRASLVAHDQHIPLRAAAPVLLLAAAARPYARVAVQSGAARVGLSVSTFGPEEVRELGALGAAAATFGRAGPGVVLLGFEADAASTFASASPAPCLGVEGAAGCTVGALADLLVLERRGPLANHRVAIVGDASPRAIDLAVAVASFGGSVSFVHPVGYAPDPDRLTVVRERAAASGAAVLDTTELMDALREATAVVVEPVPAEGAERFRPYAVARHHLRVCKPGSILLHRAAERRGAELSAALVDDPGWAAPSQRQAESWAAAALLSWALQPDRLRSVLG
jgi:ornithine carbamoyltransferase